MTEVITTKTKLLIWACVGDKEKIDLDLCDFSPEQVGKLDRLLRAGSDAKVRLSIEPEQKKLQIAPITCAVRLVSLSCRGGGQKIKVAEFHSPDDRATALKRLAANETPITISIEEMQKGLPFGSDQKPQGQVAETPRDGGGEVPRVFEPKLKGLKNCHLIVVVLQDKSAFAGSYDVKLGNREIHVPVDEGPKAESLADCLHAVQEAIAEWAVGLTMQGKAEIARRQRFLDQLSMLEWLEF